MARFFPFHWIQIRRRRQLSDVSQNLATPAMAETAVSNGPHLHHNSKKLNLLQRCCVLIFLFLVIIYGSFSFITFIFSAAFFEKKRAWHVPDFIMLFSHCILLFPGYVVIIILPSTWLKGICRLNRTGTARHRQMFGLVSGCDQGLYQSAIETEGQASPK